MVLFLNLSASFILFPTFAYYIFILPLFLFVCLFVCLSSMSPDRNQKQISFIFHLSNTNSWKGYRQHKNKHKSHKNEQPVEEI